MKSIVEYCKPNLITEYLSTKVKIHSHSGFPIENDLDTILRFLKDNDFIECMNDSVTDDMKEIFKWFENTNKPSYILKDYGENSFWIRIFKGGEMDRNNPIFVMQIEKRSGRNDELYGIEERVYDDFNWNHEQFIKEINKHFGWE